MSEAYVDVEVGTVQEERVTVLLLSHIIKFLWLKSLTKKNLFSFKSSLNII
jgi:hypothetical protein